MRISLKLLTWFLLVGIVPLLALYTLSHFQVRKVIMEEQLTKLSTTLEHRVDWIKHEFAEDQRDTEALSKNPIVIQHMAEIVRASREAGPESGAGRQLTDSFQALAEWFLGRFEFYDLFLIDVDGNVVYSAQREEDFGTNLRTGPHRRSGLSRAFALAMETGTASSTDFSFYGPSNEPAAFFAAPLVQNGSIIGVVALQADTKILSQLAANYLGLGETGEILLASRDKNTALILNSLRHAPDSAFTRRFALGPDEPTLPIQKAVLGESGRGPSVDYRGVDILAAWQHIPSIDWGIEVKIDAAEAYAPAGNLRQRMLLLGGVIIAFVLVAALIAARSFSRPVRRLTAVTQKMSAGDFKVRAPIYSGDELGQLSESFNQMAELLQSNAAVAARKGWLDRGLSKLDEAIRGQSEARALCQRAISAICRHLDKPVGAIYITREVGSEDTGHRSGALYVCGTYAQPKAGEPPEDLEPGEGLVGQAALEKRQILIKQLPDDYFKISSSLGEVKPHAVCVTPVLHEDQLVGVVEIGSLAAFSELELEFLQSALPAMGVAIDSAKAGTRLARSLEHSQLLAGELQTQQEELQTSNEELSAQTQRLRESESGLKKQQEDLKETNQQLEETNVQLLEQKTEIDNARKGLLRQTRELALASKYKSEFLANMSHELRTPLNSLLLLAQGLTKNRDNNLSEKQLQSAEIIYENGKDLLQLINEILDLAKIEAGRLDLDLKTLQVEDLANSLRRTFSALAEEKGIEYSVRIDEDTPAEVTTDRLRLEQVLRNLAGNALKFTESGSVKITFSVPTQDTVLERASLRHDQCLAIAVEDTGIGIALESQDQVFEAFRQVDSSISRRYGGTGLGLSIAQELTDILGGEIRLNSTPGKGSRFTVFIPFSPTEDTAEKTVSTKPASAPARSGGDDTRNALDHMAPLFDDDRGTIGAEDFVILIIEDDKLWAERLAKSCRKHGFKCLSAPSGETGLRLAAGRLPNGILLDIGLPGLDGWEVLTRLKDAPRTRHIPVHVISSNDEDVKSRMTGALGHAVKPVNEQELDQIIAALEDVSNPSGRRVLIIEDDAVLRSEIAKVIGHSGIEVTEAGDAASALNLMREQPFACVVLDLKLPDQPGIELLSTMRRENLDVPVIVHTARDLTPEEETELADNTAAIVIKSSRSPERLLDEVSLFLHRVVGDLSETQRETIRNQHDDEDSLRDKVVLVVDDDMRTTFALASLLSEHGMIPVKAGDGKAALEQLQQHEPIDIVLMDIMMPEMDGLEAIRRIRSQPRFRQLPIIAITAKAMKEDQQACLDAGANEYLSKPVDAGRLLSVLRIWLQA